MEGILKAILKPVVVFVVGLLIGIGGSLLKMDLKGELCKSSGPTVEIVRD